MGAAAAGGGEGRPLRPDGGRPVRIRRCPAVGLSEEAGRPARTQETRWSRGRRAGGPRDCCGARAGTAVRDPATTRPLGEHHRRRGSRKGADGDLAELAAGLRGERRSPPRGRAVRPRSAPGVPRSVRWGWSDPAGGAAVGNGGARERPEPGGGADHEGNDRDSAPVRGEVTGAPLGWEGPHGERLEGGGGARGGRSVLRAVDAGRGGAAHRPSVSEGADHTGDGAGAAGPEALRGAGVDGDRVAMGPDGAESEPGVRGRGGAVGFDVHAFDEGGEGGVRRARDRGTELPLHREDGPTRGSSRDEGGDKALTGCKFPLSPFRNADGRGPHQRVGQGGQDGRPVDGDCPGRRSPTDLSRTDNGDGGGGSSGGTELAPRTRVAERPQELLDRGVRLDKIRGSLHVPSTRRANDLLRPRW